MKGKHYQKSQAVLGYMINIDRVIALGDLAEKLQMPYTTLAKYVSGETACPPEVFARIFSITKYQPILQVSTPAGHQTIPLDPSQPDKKTVEEEIMDDVCTSSKACQTWREIMADGRYTQQEASKMLAVLEENQGELEETKALVRTFLGKGK